MNSSDFVKALSIDPSKVPVIDVSDAMNLSDLGALQKLFNKRQLTIGFLCFRLWH